MHGFYITDDDLQTHPYVVTVVHTLYSVDLCLTLVLTAPPPPLYLYYLKSTDSVRSRGPRSLVFLAYLI